MIVTTRLYHGGCACIVFMGTSPKKYPETGLNSSFTVNGTSITNTDSTDLICLHLVT